MKTEFLEVPVGMASHTIIARTAIAKVEPTLYGTTITLNTLDKNGKQEIIETSLQYDQIKAWLNKV